MDFPVYVPGYAVEHQLDVGGDGSAWVAREEATGRRVALKLLPVHDPVARERARRDAATLTAIDHPHVVPVLGVADSPGAVVLVLALADGGSLADLLAARGTLPPGEVVTVCAPIAQALAALHSRGLVHGDVSPANVVFTADGRPMLSGLGVAHVADQLLGDVSAAAVFAAPEVRSGYRPQPGADVYGLAVIAARTLTGYFPTRALMLPGIAPATQRALAQAMHPDPTRRPDAASLTNALFALADPEPVMLVSDTEIIAPIQPAPDQPADPLRHSAGAEAAETGPIAPDTTRRRAAHARATEPEVGAAVPRGSRNAAAAPGPVAAEAVDARTRHRRPSPAEPPTRRRRRFDIARIALVVAVPVILAGAVFAGLQWANGDRNEPSTLPGADRVTAPGEADVPVNLCGGPQPAPTEQPPEVSDWTQVVQSLYALRTQAFAEVDATALCEVYAPTSQALADDAELLQLYADAGVHTEALAFEVVTAELVSQEGGRVVLAITDRLPPYQLVDDDATVVAEKDGLAEETWQAELVPAPDASGWRFG
jgi:serine/threonine protein kinase